MYIKVKVRAGEKKNRFERKTPDAFEVWTKAPSERGLANAAVREILARGLNVSSKQLILIKGATGPSKIFEIK
ncbi:MAG: DUF167 domain-containing protein [Elusimicrobium sp.]|jgi:uncharacterized protein YggU (UPF0235/DUF167 family)|nr:DUF167 domain-containing protein [Elusimicrobium sp.]